MSPWRWRWLALYLSGKGKNPSAIRHKALKCFYSEGKGTFMNQTSIVLELLVCAGYLPIAQGHWASSGFPKKRLENSHIVPWAKKGLRCNGRPLLWEVCCHLLCYAYGDSLTIIITGETVSPWRWQSLALTSTVELSYLMKSIIPFRRVIRCDQDHRTAHEVKKHLEVQPSAVKKRAQCSQ